MRRKWTLWMVGGVLGCLPLVPPARADDCPEVVSISAIVHTEWTATRREADPEGYFRFVLQKLDDEADALRPACERLSQDIERQATVIKGKVQLWRKAKKLAEEFRAVYQKAERNGEWPVEVADMVYCKEQLMSQVNMFMEEAKGLAECVAKLKGVRERAEAKLEQLTVRASRVETQRSVCLTLAELWNASRIRSNGAELLASLELLIVDDPPQVAACPQRTADGFPMIADFQPEGHRSGDQVLSYLTRKTEPVRVGKPIFEQQSRASGPRAGKKSIFTQK